MPYLTPYVPAFVERDPPAGGDFNNMSELEALPWCKGFMETEGFVRFSFDGDMIIAENTDPRIGHYIVGFVDGPTPYLPIWGSNGKLFPKTQGEGSAEVPSTD